DLIPEIASSRHHVPADPTGPGCRAVLEVALQLAAESDPDRILHRIVTGAAEVTGARYAALGVYDDTGRIERFVHHGLDQETVDHIGALPEGRGLLGQLLVGDGPMRLDALTTHPA